MPTFGRRVVVDLLRRGGQRRGDTTGDQLSGIEVLVGSDYADTRWGGSADGESIYGGAGDDVLASSAGADFPARRQGGHQQVDYSASGGGVTAYLDGRLGLGGDAAGDQLANIQHLVGSGYNDVPLLTGSDTADTLDGGAGDDRLDGSAGSDDATGRRGQRYDLYGGDGADSIDGGAGWTARLFGLDLGGCHRH